MAKRTKIQPLKGPPGPGSTTGQRVAWLLEKVWDGNRSAMAAAVGVTHSVISKVANEQQSPGSRLMEAIAAHPKVNPAWLISGAGVPLLAESKSEPTGGWPVPVANQLLPGPLDDFRELLSGATFPVAGKFYQPTRYWFQLPAGESTRKFRRAGLLAGDLLLMETVSDWWKTPDWLYERLCAVRFPDSAAPRLAEVTWHPQAHDEPAFLEADDFRYPIEGTETSYEITVRITSEAEIDRAIARRIGPHRKGQRQVSRNLLGPLRVGIELASVVSACVLLVRQQI